MSIDFKYKCETCGLIFSDWEDAESHLKESGNEHHIIDEEYINQGEDGIPVQSILKSPDGTIWAISVDNNGILTTEEVI